MKLLLHIGPHKTGSSSIQGSLAAAAKDLLSKGVLYYAPSKNPAFSIAANYLSPAQRAQPELLRVFRTDDAVMEWSRDNLAELKTTVKESDARICVISSEHFSIIPKEHVFQFTRDMNEIFDEIQVLGYARDPVTLYPSEVQQNIQGGRRLADTRTPYSFRYTFRRQISKYVEFLGRKSIVVRNFDRANLERGDVVHDFAAQIGRYGVNVDIPSITVNESLPGAVIAWLLGVNETWDRSVLGNERHRVLKLLKKSETLARLPKLRLEDSGMQSLIRTRARADLNWLNDFHLKGQLPLDTTAGPVSLDDDDAVMMKWMRDWIMSYLTTDSLKLIYDEILTA